MASGINSTLRQVGLATGIALYGSLFASQLRHGVTEALLRTAYAPRAAQIAASIPPGVRTGPVPAAVSGAVRTGFTSALNEIMLVAATVALAAAVTSLVLIRARDFIPTRRPVTAPPQQTAVMTGLADQ